MKQTYKLLLCCLLFLFVLPPMALAQYEEEEEERDEDELFGGGYLRYRTDEDEDEESSRFGGGASFEGGLFETSKDPSSVLPPCAGPPDVPTDPDAPINGYVLFLFLGGAVLGGRSLMKKHARGKDVTVR